MLPFGLAVAANAVVAVLSLQFYFVPAGSHIRPMGWAGFCAMVALASIAAVIPKAIISMRQSRRYLLPLVAIVLSLLPFPLASGILHHAAALRGFILSP